MEKAKTLGVDENIAKHQARQMEELLDIAINNARAETESKELATKRDLSEMKSELKQDILAVKSELKQDTLKSKIELILWVAGMFIASGLIQHFFK